MKQKLIICICAVVLALTSAVPAYSQVKKPSNKKEEVKEPPPPPPPVMERAVLKDTVLEEEFLTFGKDMPDTSAVPEDELTAAARELIKASRQMEIATSMLRHVYESEEMKNIMPADIVQIYLAAMSPGGEGYKLLELTFIRIHRKHYTIPELKLMTEFYNSPVGKKSVETNIREGKYHYEQGAKIGAYIMKKAMASSKDD